MLALSACAWQQACHRPFVSLNQAVGAELDLSDKGLGTRSRRYAMMADDGVVSPNPWLLCWP